jgi:uncharacterized protein
MARKHEPGGVRHDRLIGEAMMKRAVVFCSEGVKLQGDIYLPDDLREGERRAGIVLCHGYTGVKDLYLPDTARALNAAGYVAMTFDYKGWGESEGSRSRLAPHTAVSRTSRQRSPI